MLEITDENFEAEVLNSGKVGLIDFGATWCGPCKRVEPLVDEISTEYDADKVVVGRVDIDVSPSIATKYGIMSVPSILYFKNGEVFDKVVGAVPKSQLVERLEKALA